MPSLPRFDTPAYLILERRGAASEVGAQRRGLTQARVLKAFASTDATAIPPPSVPPPVSQTAEPDDFDGWAAWWPAPTPGTTYIPDPPMIPRPVMPSADLPILWEASAPVGGGDWTPTISAVFARVHWQPRTGREAIAGDIEFEESLAIAKMRGSIVRLASMTAKDWRLQLVSDLSTWDIESISPSFRRGEFVELVLRKTE